jgi:hypothetical protein
MLTLQQLAVEYRTNCGCDACEILRRAVKEINTLDEEILNLHPLDEDDSGKHK